MLTNIRYSVLVAGVVVGLAGAAAHASDVKIGTVDMQKALQSTETGKKAKADLEKEVSTKSKAMQTEEASIRKMADDFKKQSSVMNDEARTKKQAEIQERAMKFEQARMKTSQELQAKEQELTQPIIAKLRGIVADMAKDKNYTVVLEKNENMVLYSLPGDDLTADVISKFNKSAEAKK